MIYTYVPTSSGNDSGRIYHFTVVVIVHSFSTSKVSTFYAFELMGVATRQN